MSTDRKQRCRNWLQEKAFPLWYFQGRDGVSFHEGLDYEGKPKVGLKRCMIQWRQVYCFTVAHQLQLFPQDKCLAAIEETSDFVDRMYSFPNGSFAHAIDTSGNKVMPHADLYNQAFSLFGLSCAYSVTGDARWKCRALKLMEYLLSERALPFGGFSETNGSQIQYESNPHMHLFEALLSWQVADSFEKKSVSTSSASEKSSPIWKEEAQKLANLATAKFVDQKSGFLAEHFSENWRPLLEEKGFVAEPGHHFEWSWLFSWAASLGLKVSSGPVGSSSFAGTSNSSVESSSMKEINFSLFQKGNAHGICSQRKSIHDEIYSDGSVKKATARYWPPCEKVKAAVRLAEISNGAEREYYQAQADEALDLLFRYLDTPLPGLCWDVLLEDNTFSPQPPRASSLYHIVNAMKEYLEIR